MKKKKKAILLRIDPAVHRDIAYEAATAHMTINAWINRVLREAVKR